MSRLLCLFGRHKPDYASIQTEDNAFSADCRRCDKEIIKRHRSPWRRRKAHIAESTAQAQAGSPTC